MNQNFFKRIKIVRHLEPTERGGSRPQYMGSEDGTIYVVKFKENKQGIKVLVNELVANGIACSLKLPCPEGVFAEINDELLRISNIEINGRQISPGLHFGILKIENSYFPPPANLISQVDNKDVFPCIILFDILTFNCDRSINNCVIQVKEDDRYKFFIIDHGHCFGSPKWDASLVDKVGTWNGNVMPEVANCIEGTDPFRIHVEKIKKSLSNELISKIVNEVPNEWEITSEERKALKAFLIGQRDRIEEIILNNKNLFPKWK